MTKPFFLVDLNLNQPLQTLNSLEAYSSVRGLVIWGTEALGEVELPVKGGCCSTEDQREAIANKFSNEILLRSLSDSLATGQWNPDLTWSELIQQQEAKSTSQHFTDTDEALTVVLCWAAAQGNVSASQLSACLTHLDASFASLPKQALELIVVGPADCESLVQAAQGKLALRYLPDESNDLATQRHLAITASRGSLIAFLSPQVQVGSGWALAIVRGFSADPSTMVMTGPLLPADETSNAWELLRGQDIANPSFDRWWYRQSSIPSERWNQVYFHHPIPEQNIAFRRAALSQVLDKGETLENSYCLTFEQMAQGNSLCNDAAMWARESLEQDPEQLIAKAQQEANRLGQYFAQGSLITQDVPSGYRPIFLKESLGGLRWYGQSSLQQSGLAKQFFQAKLKGFSAGLKDVLGTVGTVSSLKQGLAGLKEALPGQAVSERQAKDSQRMASRSIDLGQPLPHWDDLDAYEGVRVFITHQETLLGQVDLWHNGSEVSSQQIAQVVVRKLRDRLFLQSQNGHTQTWQSLELQLAHWLQPQPAASAEEMTVTPQALPLSVPVSVIITTCDRPEDLRNCLQHLRAQTSDRQFEIIVADNRPASGITPTVVKDFPGVKLVSEPRVGGSYGRNSAFCASTGDIVVTVDDDVTVPPNWLEKLLAPMARPEVMVVTGNVLPRELETEAQRMYEDLYGGLGEGLETLEVNGQWLSSFNYSPPVWDLGVSANSAFRASVFHHPEIGMMPEALGPGTPVGGGEENYLIYRILRAGGTLVYEPSAYAWHRHRRTIPELRYQIYRQMMGGTAYHLRLWQVDQDMRAKQQLLTGLPSYFTSRVIERAKGQNQVPWRFIWAEISGYLAGFWGYRQSLKAVERQGYSEPYIPVSERSSSPGKSASLEDAEKSLQAATSQYS